MFQLKLNMLVFAHKSSHLHEGSGPIGGMPSVGVFLRVELSSVVGLSPIDYTRSSYDYGVSALLQTTNLSHRWGFFLVRQKSNWINVNHLVS